ncbi:MAG TPA: response regulator [Bdellovibrionota bacterium]
MENHLGQDEGHKQILVIEDDDSIREALEELFVSEGYSVAMAENGSTGLETLAKVKPCLVLLDLMMPVMDGRGFLRAMAQAENRSVAKTPVVLITAAGEKGAAGCQVSEVLTKPIDIAKLLQVAQRYCH